MKIRKLYQVRREMGKGCSSKQVGHKMRLLPKRQALRVVEYLVTRGFDAFTAPVTVRG